MPCNITTVKEDDEGQYIEIPPEYLVNDDTLMIHRVGSCLCLFPRSCPHPPEWADTDEVNGLATQYP